jgi:hypothetical protein
MASAPATAHDALIDRADRAIAEATALCAEARARRLPAAGRRGGSRPSPKNPKLLMPVLTEPFPSFETPLDIFQKRDRP